MTICGTARQDGGPIELCHNDPDLQFATALSAAALTLLLRLREPSRTPAAPRHVLLELQDGARLVWRHPLLRPILATSVVWNISWFVLQAWVIWASRVRRLQALPANVD